MSSHPAQLCPSFSFAVLWPLQASLWRQLACALCDEKALVQAGDLNYLGLSSSLEGAAWAEDRLLMGDMQSSGPCQIGNLLWAEVERLTSI